MSEKKLIRNIVGHDEDEQLEYCDRCNNTGSINCYMSIPPHTFTLLQFQWACAEVPVVRWDRMCGEMVWWIRPMVKI